MYVGTFWDNLLRDAIAAIAFTDAASGGIAPNQVIARSEFEVHRHIYTEWM